MKIVHVVDSLELGGVEVLVAQLCRLQRDQGHDPSVYSIAGLGVLGEPLRAQGVDVRSGAGRRLPDAARNLYRIFRSLQPDAVHLHNRTPAVHAAIPARVAGVPSIVSTRHSQVAPPHRALAEMKFAVAASCCDWVAGVCDATACNLRHLHTVSAKKIVRVYNGAEPLLRVPRGECPASSGFTLLYVGRLAPVKNLSLLLDAFRIAFSSMPTIRLWVVGDGTERLTLQQLAVELGIAREVACFGRHLNVAPFFSAADAFIMSSISEGLPVSLLQAFSLGLPAIVTDVGGMAEAVRLAQAGIIVAPNDAKEMSAAILRMASSASERKVFSMNAEVTFRANFTLQAMNDAYMDLYRNTARAHPRAETEAGAKVARH